MAFAVFAFSLPVFVVGYILAYVFALQFEWLPVQGYTPLAAGLWPWLQNLILPALALGSHLDSVPNGGWLDGALGVMAALGVLRAWAGAGERPPRSLTLIDWADEEGARFGRSLFGSSAFSGTLDPAQVRDLRDADGASLPSFILLPFFNSSKYPQIDQHGP